MPTPGRDAGSNRTTSSGRRIRRKGPPSPKRSTTPKVQPGPYRATERKKVESFKRTPTYRTALREARKKGPATRRGTRRPGGDDKSDADRARAEAYVRAQYLKRYGRDLGTIRRKSDGRVVSGYRPGSTVPPRIQEKVDLVLKADKATVDRTAPVAKVLEQTARPIHAVAAAAKSEVKNIKKDGFSPFGSEEGRKRNLAAAKRGFQLKDKTLFSDVLKEAGVKNKAVAGTLGFALDVGLDPTTYVTLGGSTPAAVARRKALRQGEREAVKSGATKTAGDKARDQALKRGASKKEANRAGRTAARKNARRAGEKAGRQAAAGKATNRGLSVRFGGHEIPGLTRGTAAAKRAPRAVARKTKADQTRAGRKVDRGQQRVRDAVRNLGSDFNPAIAPAGVDRVAYQEARRSARTARASAQRGTFRAGQRAIAFRRAIGEKNYERVIDAIEEGTVKSLPSELRQVARELERDFDRMLKQERRAGIKVGDVRKKADGPKGYVHQLRIKDEEKRGGTPSVGSKKVAPSFGKRRSEGTIAEKNAAEPGAYSTDVADIYLNRGAESAVSVAKARLNQAMLKAGRRVDRSRPVKDQVGTDEALYRVDGSDLVKVGGDEARNLRKGGRYVILNEKLVSRTRGTVQSAAERSTAGVFFDRAQGVWKLAATQINPGYHVRNFFGEAQNAYLASGNALILGRNAAQAARALRQLGRNEDAERVLGKTAKGAGSERDRFIRQAEDVGAVRAGQLGREVGEMLAGQSKKAGPRKARARTLARKPARALKNVEDVFRLATYKEGIDRGLSPERAMQRAAKFHFDYADLTPLERTALRRVFPFYTFSARNIPLQIKMLVKRPGKFAQYEKIRGELQKAFGVPDDWQKDLSEYEQRGAPLPVKIGGKTYNVGLGPSGLPLTDLNEMPVSMDPRKLADEWTSRAVSLLTPAASTPIELWANFSFFFRDQIERDEGPLAPAPSWVQYIPENYREEMGIVPDYLDKRTGKKGWGAPAKVIYALGKLPGPINFSNRLLTDSERPGQSTGNKILAYSGIRVRENDPLTVAINSLYETRQDVSKKAAAWRQRGVSAANANKEYRALLDREKLLTSEIMRLRTKRGDKIQGGRKPSTGSSGGSSGDSFWGSGGGSSSSESFWGG